MNYEHATIVITLAVATALRRLAQVLDRNETDGMFLTGLSATGNLPATHFISSGQVPVEFIRAMESPALLRTNAQAAFVKEGVAFTFTLTQITAALAGCTLSNGKRTVVIDTVPTVVNESPYEFIARLNLKIVGTAI